MPIDLENQIVCLHCAESVGPFDHFCPQCGGPNTAHAAIDPLGQVLTAGWGYRNAIETPRLIVVIGIWLIFGPALPFYICLVFGSLFELTHETVSLAVIGGSRFEPAGRDAMGGIVSLTTLIFIITIHGMMIWKVTACYLRHNTAGHDPDSQAS
jgi:hypothetical protein